MSEAYERKRKDGLFYIYFYPMSLFNWSLIFFTIISLNDVDIIDAAQKDHEQSFSQRNWIVNN